MLLYLRRRTDGLQDSDDDEMKVFWSPPLSALHSAQAKCWPSASRFRYSHETVLNKCYKKQSLENHKCRILYAFYKLDLLYVIYSRDYSWRDFSRTADFLDPLSISRVFYAWKQWYNNLALIIPPKLNNPSLACRQCSHQYLKTKLNKTTTTNFFTSIYLFSFWIFLIL